MKRTSLILIAVFALVMLPAAFGQGTPSQSQDPNAAQPTATPSQQTPSAQPSTTPSTSDPTSSSAAGSTDARSFVGSIMKTGGKYVLHTGGTDYQLDDQAQAGKFKGKDVKVTGQLDQSSNTIKVQSIEPSSSM
jgi:ABC-type transport system substrate-binding protein